MKCFCGILTILQLLFANAEHESMGQYCSVMLLFKLERAILALSENRARFTFVISIALKELCILCYDAHLNPGLIVSCRENAESITTTY